MPISFFADEPWSIGAEKISPGFEKARQMTVMSSEGHLQVIRRGICCLRSTVPGDVMRILVVEDEARIRAFLARAFEAEGFNVDVAKDGERGVTLALACRYELVILDVLLPGSDGLDVLRDLHRERPALPVLILSARADLATKLPARTRVQLRRAIPSDGDSILRAGTLALDVTRRRACVGDVVADLSDREFRVLHFLMLHVGQVISRERLLSEVWGYDFDPRSNVVDVCVRRLRRQLGPDAPIETVRNAGYRAAA